MLRWLRRLGAIPTIVTAFAVLRMDVEGSLKSGAVNAAIERFRRDPAIAPLVPRISAEWRALEEALNRLK